MVLKNIPQVLTIAGSDSSGGAGLNADTRLFTLEHVYAATVLTGITAQNTSGVQQAQAVTPELLTAQLVSVFSDLDIKVIKTGALFNEAIVKTISDYIIQIPSIPLIIDPVMIAKGGAKLLSDDAVTILVKKLLPLAYLITPNTKEAEVITGITISSKEDMLIAAKIIQELGAQNVLVKGGHMSGKNVIDLLYTKNGDIHWYESPRINTIRTHGTGDTLSAYITAKLAKNMTLEEIMPLANTYMAKVIGQGILVGHGHGPLNLWAK